MARAMVGASLTLLSALSLLLQPRTEATTVHATFKHTARAAAHEAGQLQGAPQAFSSGDKHLEVVIATYDVDRLEESARTWERLLAIPKVAALLPYVTIYNQNPSGESSGWLEDELRTVLHNGRVIYLTNKGRESRIYMHHIVNNWHNLYRYTWFSQDLPSEYARERVETLFMPGRTAMLGVGPSWPASCDDHDENSWVEGIDASTHLFEMVHEMVKGTPCDKEVWAAFKGEFIVSDQRIHENDLSLYRNLLELLEAPRDHPIHSRHSDERFKDPSNPWFGHVMERAWSLLFNCSDLRMGPGCLACESQGWEGCEPESCQCTEP